MHILTITKSLDNISVIFYSKEILNILNILKDPSLLQKHHRKFINKVSEIKIGSYYFNSFRSA